MLIETRIRFTVPELDAGQVEEAVSGAQQAMRQTRDELREPVSLYQVSKLSGTMIGYCVRGLGSHKDREFTYDYATQELSALQVKNPAPDLRIALAILKGLN